MDFLYSQLGLSKDYIKGRISTVFLDSKPVDNLDESLIKDGSTLALSGSMPGLMGAIMRSGSTYSSMRHSITHREEDDKLNHAEGIIKLKLFNVILADLGMDFLKKGVEISPSDFIYFTEKRVDDFIDGCIELKIDGKSESLSLLNNWNIGIEDDLISLKIEIDE